MNPPLNRADLIALCGRLPDSYEDYPFDDPNCSNGGSAGCQALWMSSGYYGRVYVPNPSPFVTDPATRVAGGGNWILARIAEGRR